MVSNGYATAAGKQWPVRGLQEVSVECNSQHQASWRLARLVQGPDDGLSRAGDGHKAPALQFQLVENFARTRRRLVDVTEKKKSVSDKAVTKEDQQQETMQS